MSRKGVFSASLAAWSTTLAPPWNTARLHRSPDLYPQPTRFDPARWLAPAPEHRASYLPFGTGVRNSRARSPMWSET